MNKIITRRIDALIAALLPDGAGTISAAHMRTALEQVAQTAFGAGRADALQSLRTGSEAAELWGVTRQRASALIQRLHKQYGVGMQVGHVWLLTTDDIERYKPDRHAPRPRKA